MPLTGRSLITVQGKVLNSSNIEFLYFNCIYILYLDDIYLINYTDENFNFNFGHMTYSIVRPFYV